MLRINIRRYPRGKTDEYSAGGLKARTLGSLARKLKRIGIPDSRFEVYRGDMKCMVGESLYVEAGLMLIESDQSGLIRVPYKEPPLSKLAQEKAKNRLVLQKGVGNFRLPVTPVATGEEFAAKIEANFGCLGDLRC